MMIKNKGNIVSIGFDETLYAIKLNVVKTIILSAGYHKYAVKLMVDKDAQVKQVKFVKNDIELKEVSKALLSTSSDMNGLNIEIESFVRFWDNLCDLNNIDLQMIGIHSPLTQQFAKGLSGCVGILYYPINLQDNDDDDDEEWLSDDE